MFFYKRFYLLVLLGSISFIMKYLNSFLLVILLCGISCTNSKKVEEVADTKDSLAVDSDRISSQLVETLIPSAKMDVEKWKEYEKVDEFILKFYGVTALEALSNAQELADLVGHMKDSVRLRKLDEPSTLARINVLHNETLRLADMNKIPSIKKEEVKQTVSKILEFYSAFNSKINTIYKSEEVQNSLEIDTETPIDMDETKSEMIEIYGAQPRKKYID